MFKIHLITILFVLTGIITGTAQSLSPGVISSAGGTGNTEGISLNWTTGEVVVQTFTTDSLTLSQGFQQGNYTIATAANTLQGTGMEVDVYPNPVRHNLSVNFEELTDETVQLKLLNLTGKVIMIREISDPINVYRMNMRNINPGSYMLIVRVDNGRKTFKIIKQ